MSKLQSQRISTDKRVEQMVNRLKEGNHRITPQRLGIIKVLAKSREHPSAESIYAAMVTHYPTMSLATVYKTLAILKQEGEVLELQFSDLGNRYDGYTPYPHPHVICTQCGEIVDPSLMDLKNITTKMMNETGFKIVAHRLDFYGLCPDCQDKS